jgi:hypothetical protein
MAAIVADRIDEILLSVVAIGSEESELAATRAMKTLMDHGTALRDRGLD